MKLKLSVLGAAAILILLSFFWMNPDKPLPKDASGKIDKLFSEYMEKYNAPGSLVGIWVPGKGVHVKAYGTSDIATGRKAKATDRFRIGSNTKTMTATVILQLVEEGLISLDDKLSKYEPKVRGSGNITVRQLLNMTSGLHNYTEMPSLFEKFEADRSIGFTPFELVKLGLKHKPDFEPGKGMHYSNTNYILLGMIIEKVTGNKYEDEVEKRIVRRLGLKNTYYPVSASMEGRFLHGYMTDDDGSLVDWSSENVSWGWAAGGMVSNLFDMKKYAEALCNGTFLGAGLQEKRMNEWVDMGSKKIPSLKYGLGIFTLDGYVGHNGGLPGYISMAMHNPSTKATVVFVFNNQAEHGDTIEVMKKIIEIL